MFTISTTLRCLIRFPASEKRLHFTKTFNNAITSLALESGFFVQDSQRLPSSSRAYGNRILLGHDYWWGGHRVAAIEVRGG